MIAAFSVTREQPLVAPVARISFDEIAATGTLRELATEYPNRSPGAAGSKNLLSWIDDKFNGLGLTPQEDEFGATIPGLGKVSLTNVSATVEGRSSAAIVILAHRDNSGQGPGGGADDNASGTGAMLELARAYQNRSGFSAPPRPTHTIIFLSTDGGAFGAIGAAHFAHRYGTKKHIAAVIVLDAVAGTGAPRVLINGDAPRSPDPVLVATAFQILGEQPGAVVTHASALDQLLDLAFPFSLYEQAPFVARGIPAVTFTTGGDRPPSPLTDTTRNISAAHLAVIGRASEQLIAALDQGAPEPRSSSAGYMYLGGRFVAGWALQLVLIVASLPAIVAVVDLFARCRRRRVSFRPAFRSLGRRLGFWLSALVFFLLFALFGFWPKGVDRPPSLDSSAATSLPFGAIVLFSLLVFAAWLITRERLLPKSEVSSEDELAGYTVALLLLAVLWLVVASLNSYALLFLLPSLHAWIWLPQLRHLRPWASFGLMLAGLIGPLILFWELAARLELGLNVVWYVAELGAVGYLGFMFLLVATAFSAVAAQLAALSVGRYAPYPAADERPPTNLPQRLIRRASLLTSRRRETGATHGARGAGEP